MQRLKRRDFLRLTQVFGASALVGSGIWQDAIAAVATATSGPGPYGPLQPPDANGIMLPGGFSSTVLAQAFEVVPGTSLEWHLFPDGGDVFSLPGGWAYVSNSEDFSGVGRGVNALRFDHSGAIIDAYNICSGTNVNCAGGRTPWGTWLTCEETATGLVHECDPAGISPQQALPAMGRFQHEAAAADPENRRFYLTEDQGDGLFYRFTPNTWGDLTSGVLEAAKVDGDDVTWLTVPEPDWLGGSGTPTRQQVPGATTFDGGEGIVYTGRHLYFTTKGDDRVWDYDPNAEKICVLYDKALDPAQQLNGVDNITADRWGDLVVAEDHGGGDQELVWIGTNGVVSPFLRLTGQFGSELTGPAFSPDGRTLYVSSQRGGSLSLGITYAITGPFRIRGLHC